MALKDLKSIFDLVSGESPVSSMADQAGPQSQLPTDAASQKHIDSLQQIPNNSPFQDLNGEINPNYNTLDGNIDSPFNTSNGDHMITLLNESVQSSNTNQTYDPSSQDLNGFAGPQSQQPIEDASAKHIESLSEVPGGVENSPYQDLNGAPGPNFGNYQDSTLHNPDSLLQEYQYQYGNSPESVMPSGLDISAQPGTPFDNGNTNVDLLRDSLFNAYVYSHGQGNNPFGNSQGISGPSTLDLNGEGTINEATFDNGPNSTLHEDTLQGMYESTINPGASYGQGQPGAIWPQVNAPINDLNGTFPTNGQYLNNLPT